MYTEEAAVLSTIERMVRSFQEGHLDRLMETYEPRPNIAFQAGEGTTDPALIRETFSAAAAMKPVYEFAGHEVLIAGDLALHITPWKMSATTTDGSVEDRGLSVSVLRRQTDGAWKLVIDNPYGGRLLGAD